MKSVLIGSLLFSVTHCLLATNLTYSGFNLNEGNKNAWLSAAAYCGAAEYESHVFKGPTEGFVVTYVMDDRRDTQGFVGYLPSDQSIYVVFRGSSDIKNWMTDLSVVKVSYKGYCCGKACKIHRGFYGEAQEEFDGIYEAVKELQNKYPSYKVKTTGHSLGAALSQITAMMLKDEGINVATHYNFGQPRIGDANYAECASSYVTTERVTHLKDTVPHIPFESWGFVHECREAYESTTTTVNPQVKDCSTTNCDDPTCAEQWQFKNTNAADHCIYLGLEICSCSAVS